MVTYLVIILCLKPRTRSRVIAHSSKIKAAKEKNAEAEYVKANILLFNCNVL